MFEKTIFLVLAGMLSTSIKAQNVDQGKKYFYYHRYQSAKDEFNNVLVRDPNNQAASYWLGQTLIEDGDSTAAKTLYQKVLATNPNSPLILAGMGQIDLMDNNASQAKQRFQHALDLTKGEDVEVVHAIARANIEAKPGNAGYAIERLNAIPKKKKKDQKNAETYLLMGKAYRKLVNGGEAVSAFRQALSMNPSLAEARYEIGRIYLTQNNPEAFLPAFEEAVQIDPNYAPAYYELFYYWFERDINKARVYFNQYVAVSDKTPTSDYDRISIIYASRDYQHAIDSAKDKINQLGAKADPRYYKLAAYSYDALKDSVNAKSYLDQYFTHQAKEDFVPQDYVFRGKILGMFPGNEQEASNSFEMAVQLDTSAEGRLKTINDAAAFAARTGNYSQQATWLGKLYQAEKDPSNRDLYNWGYAHYKAGNYVTADSIFCNIYTQKYPDEIFGYLWCARAAGAQDTSMEKGTAIAPYKRLISFARASGEREDYKATLIQAHGYLASYYANVAKDKDSAVTYLQNILKLDSTNASAAQYIEVLTKPAEKSPAQAPVKRKPSAVKRKTKK